MTYYKKLIQESIAQYKLNSPEKRLKTVENLTNHLNLQKINKVKLTETDKASQIFLRAIKIYKL